jgi:hypothetical protein
MSWPSLLVVVDDEPEQPDDGSGAGLKRDNRALKTSDDGAGM